jgi:hypothetical protein
MTGNKGVTLRIDLTANAAASMSAPAENRRRLPETLTLR